MSQQTLTKKKLIAALNSIPQYDLICKTYYEDMVRQETCGGDYIRTDDISETLAAIGIKYDVVTGKFSLSATAKKEV